MGLKEDKIAQFTALGVEEKDIFKEIVRARYLDYVIFSKRENEEFGLSPEEFREKADALSWEKFGHVPEDAERFAYIYTAAMSVDPMLFAENAGKVSEMARAVLQKAIAAAEELPAGKTVLFAGAERYLPCLTDIFVHLRNKRIAMTIADCAWQETAQMIYARGRAMAPADVSSDTEVYDYIFYMGGADEDAETLLAALISHLKEGGAMDVLLPHEFFKERAVLSDLARAKRVEHFCHVTDGEAELMYLHISEKNAEGNIFFGEGFTAGGAFCMEDRLSMTRADFAAAENWDYDVYAYNGNPTLQAILGAGILDLDFAVGNRYKTAPKLVGTMGTYPVITAAAVTASGILTESVQETEISDVRRVEAGDLVIAATEDGIFTAVVPDSLNGAAVAPGLFVLRPMDEYTAEYLKAYLDGPIGRLFLETMKTGRMWHICNERLLRIPMKEISSERIEAITLAVRETTENLAAAEEAWREVKRDAVKLMLG